MKAECSILTKEERDVLLLVAAHPNDQHLNNAEIAKRLGISLSKVKILIHNACVKLKAHNRVEATFLAVRKGEIRLDEIYTLDEVAELLGSMSPDGLETIAYLVREGLDYEYLLKYDERFIRMVRRQDNILTRGERNVLALVGRGLTNREIADKLYMSTSTVRSFLHRSCTKLGTHNRHDAVVLALKRGEILISDIVSLKEFLENIALMGSESIEKLARLMSQKLRQDSASNGSLYNNIYSALFRIKSYLRLPVR